MSDLSFQLYSARKFALEDTLRTLAEIGYSRVETFGNVDQARPGGLGGLYGDVDDLKGKLEAHRLSVPTAHFGLDLLEQPEQALRIADVLGVRMLICSSIPPAWRATNAAGWQRIAEELSKTAEPFLSRGFFFAYHNHDFEFAHTSDGRLPMDILLDANPHIGVQADIAWMFRGNADPFAFIKTHGKRITAVHIKDMAAAGEAREEDGWADVGHGILPWRDLIQAIRETGSDPYYVAEHDNPSDPKRFAERSFEAFEDLMPP